MTYMKTAVGGALALAFAACGSHSTSDPFAAATPNASGLTLEVQGTAAEGITPANALSAALQPAATSSLTAQDDLQAAQGALKELNDIVTDLLEKLGDVVAAGGPPASGETRTYGPADRCVVGTDLSTCTKATFKLEVDHVRDQLYAWNLRAWAVGAGPSTGLVVAAGWMAKGDEDHRGVGKVVLDLDHLASVVPTYPGRGALLAGFANGIMGKAVTYRLRDFTPDVNVHAGVYLTIAGFHNLVTGTSRVRVAVIKEVVPPSSGSDLGPELVHTHFVWNAPLGGRGFSIVTNWENPFLATLSLPIGPYGDVPYVTNYDEHYDFVRSCYAPNTAALLFRQVFLCDGAGNATPETPAACVLRVGPTNGTVLYPASPAPTDTWANLCAINLTAHPDLDAPSAVPTTDPDDGQADTDGLGTLAVPPAPPSGPTDVAPPAA